MNTSMLADIRQSHTQSPSDKDDSLIVHSLATPQTLTDNDLYEATAAAQAALVDMQAEYKQLEREVVRIDGSFKPRCEGRKAKGSVKHPPRVDKRILRMGNKTFKEKLGTAMTVSTGHDFERPAFAERQVPVTTSFSSNHVEPSSMTEQPVTTPVPASSKDVEPTSMMQQQAPAAVSSQNGELSSKIEQRVTAPSPASSKNEETCSQTEEQQAPPLTPTPEKYDEPSSKPKQTPKDPLAIDMNEEHTTTTSMIRQRKPPIDLYTKVQINLQDYYDEMPLIKESTRKRKRELSAHADDDADEGLERPTKREASVENVVDQSLAPEDMKRNKHGQIMKAVWAKR